MRPSIQKRFEEFDTAHPEVYRLFCSLVDQLIRSGKQRYSSDSVLHRIRWEYAVNPGREFDGFKINNDFSSRYARKYAGDWPDRIEFFETRMLKDGRDTVFPETFAF